MNATKSPTPPSREQLQGSLRNLHEELARSPRLDSEARRQLQALLTEVHRLLQRAPQEQAAPTGSSVSAPVPTAPAPGPGAASGVPAERLEALAVQFEAQHPVLAGSLRQFIELCSRAGL